MAKPSDHTIELESRDAYDEDTGRRGREFRAVIRDGRRRPIGQTDWQPNQWDAFDEADTLIARWREEEHGEDLDALSAREPVHATYDIAF